jgi:acyl-CoA synthetase (NDP forming)
MSPDALLRPRSIAVLGASERPSIGRSIMTSLEKLGFEGSVYPINPKYAEILGRPCYPSMKDIPEAPDVVAFCVSSARVLENMEFAAERGARGAVVYDGGFAEQGEEGCALQAAVTAVCRSASIALCGPNCMGVLNPHDRSSVYMQELADPARLAGNVGLISQSGSICIGMLADVRRFGFSHVISSGNEAVVSAVDYLEALIEDEETKVIALFVESVREPDRFVAALDQAADAGKPVVVLKVGRSERVRRAITSHTGGLAGSARVFSEVLRTHRAIEAHDLDEFTEVLAACQAARWPQGRRTSVITFSGGQAELILDVATQAGLELPPLPPEERAEVERVVGAISGDGNPLDAWGNGDVATNLPHALRVLDRSASCDTIVLCSDASDGQPMGRAERVLEYMRHVVEAAGSSRKPHYVMGMRPGVMMRAQVDFLRQNGLINIGGARQGLGALDRLARWSAALAAHRPTRALSGGGAAGALKQSPGRRTINEFDAKSLLAKEGLPVTRERLVTSFDAAASAADELGYPVVLKAVSDDIAHKSDLGLVLVGIRGPGELRSAWDLLQERMRAAAQHGAVTGVLVQEMVEGGIEVFAGVNRDPDFGLVLAFGLGGVAVEILQDVALRMLPLRGGDAIAMVEEIRGAALLRGARGAGPFDVAALVECLEAFADYAWADRERLAEIDLNPIKVLPVGQGCRIVDALIVPRT